MRRVNINIRSLNKGDNYGRIYGTHLSCRLCFLFFAFLFFRSNRFKEYLHLRKFSYSKQLRQTFKEIIKEIQHLYPRELKIVVKPLPDHPYKNKHMFIFLEDVVDSLDERMPVLGVELDSNIKKIEDVKPVIYMFTKHTYAKYAFQDAYDIIKRHMKKLESTS